MPFDATEMSPHDKLRALAAAGRGQMPEGFTWNFAYVHHVTDCGTAGCMLGLGIECGLIPASFSGRHLPVGSLPQLSAFLDIPQMAADRIFFSDRAYGVRRWSDITPVMVADEIDRYLASVEAKAEVV